MIQNSFCHIPGIGKKREKTIHECGFHSWEDIISIPDDSSLPPNWPKGLGLSYVQEELQESLLRLKENDAQYFYRSLPSAESWRLYGFKGIRPVYLDIETTGLDSSSVVTTAVLYDENEIHSFVEGENLHSLPEKIKEFNTVITYNGSCFDLPFLSRQFKTEFPMMQIDLRFILHQMGYRGGLKGCERALGIERKGAADLNGRDAVTLWNMYCRSKDRKYLETLLAYNAEDTLNLHIILMLVLNAKAEELNLPLPRREIPVFKNPPFQADRSVIDEVKGHNTSMEKN